MKTVLLSVELTT